MAEGKIVLVVEDDPFLEDLLAVKLKTPPWNIVMSQSGEEALKELETVRPSIILLDIILPGMTGFEVLEKIKQNKDLATVPVVILSNLGQEEDIKRGKDLGAHSFLVKAQFTLDEVITKIEEVVG